MDDGSEAVVRNSSLRGNSLGVTGKCFKFVDDVVRCPIGGSKLVLSVHGGASGPLHENQVIFSCQLELRC